MVKKQSFKMGILQSVKKAVKHVDWLCSLDLKDVYMPQKFL